MKAPYSDRRGGRGAALGVAALVLLLAPGCTLVARPAPPAPGAPPGADPALLPGDWFEEGVASWYGRPFHGRTTASGERYDMDGPTAAHRTLPFGTVVEVHNLDNGARTRLRINDRGPFVDDRILDVSRHGARELGMIAPGTARVRLAIVESPEPQRCWEVQAGAFRSNVNAAARRDRLREAGHTARVVTVEQDLHRVLVGPFDSEDRASRAAAELEGVRVSCRGGAFDVRGSDPGD